MMIVRIFDTAMDPADVERGKQIFREQVKPTFEAFPGCHGIDMYLGIDEHTQDLVEVSAISRWESMDAIAQATETEEYERSLAELRRLFQQNPIVRHFETID